MIITIFKGMVYSVDMNDKRRVFKDSDWAEVHDYDTNGTDKDLLYTDEKGNQFDAYEVKIINSKEDK